MDNASTDETRRIGQALAAEDERIRYERNCKNVGAIENFNQSFRKTRGRYFKWAACDDLCAPEFLERCVELLEEDPGAVLAHTGVRAIDAEGELLPYNEKERAFVDRAGVLRPFDWQAHAAMAMLTDAVSERFAATLLTTTADYEIYGLIRRSALERTDLLLLHGEEGLLVSELSLLGRFAHATEPLFLRRFYADNVPGTRRELIQMQSGERAAAIAPLLWRLCRVFNFLRAATTIGDLAPAERLRCVEAVLRYVVPPRRYVINYLA